MPVHEVTRILTALAPALDRAHAKGIIHRDLKPSNILFDEDGNPYLADFGLARLTEASTVMTRTGVMGTPAYMSPEQAMGAKDLDARTDLYALGVIVFHMLTGQLPFDADSAIAMVAQHVNAPVPRIRAFKTDLPAKADQLINKAMAKRREVRYQNAGSIAADLATWPGSSRAPATPKPPRWLGPEIAGKATAARVPPAATPSARPPAATAVPAGRTDSLDRPSTPGMAPPRLKGILLAGGILALGMVPLAVLGLVLGLLFAKGGGTSATQTPPAATVTQPADAAA